MLKVPVRVFSERATFGALQTEEWGQFLHICDLINATEEGPKDAVKALKKKLSKNCNHKEIRLTLSLLDMCIENCGPRFQSLVVKKDFCKDKLVKLLNPRYNLPIDMQEKILTFIMTWARGFQGMVDVSEVKEVYLELLKKGVEFPSSDTNTGPKQTLSQPSTKSSPSSASPAKHSLLPLPAGPTLLLTPEQIGKLYSELDMAKMNVKVMSSILKENVPGSENPDDMNLLQKLYKTCRMMQERIMELLVTVENEDVIAELIQVNEDLNNVLLGHERFSRNRVRFLENQRIQREREELYRKQPSAPSSDLLDLCTDSPSPVSAVVGTDSEMSQFSGLNCISAHPEDTNRQYPSIYPQLDLATTAEAQQFLFATEAQNNSVSVPAGHTYSNLTTLLSPVPLNPVNLQTGHTTSLNGASPTAASKSKSQAPHYYEIMEFDPLAPKEAIYEEIDDVLPKPEIKKDAEC
ncbi:TOM1-like protein 1 isoform X2 [Struthio camelus]|uniref:TOM1-like protein 1 isoform X2 n=1 Tax=Struthio camelus TaxID=8801 RepID=UPI00051E459D|nr:PREDICTED: TOM1-like protein 1 isoform X1 [Struthio camelus australis]XP_009677196.1 PREDICTED: TOM1-like protein 1 isoform X1 [Struthio camelus australis]